ncbi:hypothetical protein [Kribbella sp. NPDC006257]
MRDPPGMAGPGICSQPVSWSADKVQLLSAYGRTHHKGTWYCARHPRTDA